MCYKCKCLLFSDGCDQFFADSPLTSLFYPSNYDINADDCWTFNAAPGQIVSNGEMEKKRMYGNEEKYGKHCGIERWRKERWGGKRKDRGREDDLVHLMYEEEHRE